MLKSFHVRNFQSLKDVKVEFSPGVTTIVGPNDRGKSAFIRALQLVSLNKLSRSPDSYIRHGEKRLILNLKIDKHTVIRKKGKGVNSYTINGKKLEAFGKSVVPQEIDRILNVGRENFQRQQDQHFWLSDTAGQVSKRLNEMVNLGLIDQSLSYIASEVKKSRSEVELNFKSLKESQSRLDQLDWVPELDAKLTELEAVKASRDKAAQNAQQLKSWVLAMQAASKGRNSLKRAARAGETAVAAGRQLEELKDKAAQLTNLIQRMKKARKILNLQIPDFKPLAKLRAEADAIAERWRKFNYLINDLNVTRKELWKLQGELEAKEKRLVKLGKNRRCEKCGQKLSRSSSLIYTCHKHRPLVGRRKEVRGTT